MPSLGFLSLPGEIRNKIYSQLLLIPPLSQHRLLGNSPLCLSILYVCKQVHSEAEEMLYGDNTFLAHSSLLNGLPRLRLCYDMIKSQRVISLIRKYHLRIRLDCDPAFTWKQTQEAFTGVEELTIEVFESQFGSSDAKVLRLFEGVRGVKEAKIYGSIAAFPEYVPWLEDSIMRSKDEPVVQIGADVSPKPVTRCYDMWSVL